MTTRLAEKNDIFRLVELSSEMIGEQASTDRLTRRFETYFNTPVRGVMVLLDENDVIAGMATLNLVQTLLKTECRMDEVIVTETARGHGYGRELVEASEAWAWEHGADVMGFTSRPSREAASALYRKLGFELYDTNVYTKTRS